MPVTRLCSGHVKPTPVTRRCLSHGKPMPVMRTWPGLMATRVSRKTV